MSSSLENAVDNPGSAPPFPVAAAPVVLPTPDDGAPVDTVAAAAVNEADNVQPPTLAHIAPGNADVTLFDNPHIGDPEAPHYAVHSGRIIGVFSHSGTAHAQTSKFSGGSMQKYGSRAAAIAAFHMHRMNSNLPPIPAPINPGPIYIQIPEPEPVHLPAPAPVHAPGLPAAPAPATQHSSASAAPASILQTDFEAALAAAAVGSSTGRAGSPTHGRSQATMAEHFNLLDKITSSNEVHQRSSSHIPSIVHRNLETLPVCAFERADSKLHDSLAAVIRTEVYSLHARYEVLRRDGRRARKDAESHDRSAVLGHHVDFNRGQRDASLTLAIRSNEMADLVFRRINVLLEQAERESSCAEAIRAAFDYNVPVPASERGHATHVESVSKSLERDWNLSPSMDGDESQDMPATDSTIFSAFTASDIERSDASNSAGPTPAPSEADLDEDSETGNSEDTNVTVRDRPSPLSIASFDGPQGEPELVFAASPVAGNFEHPLRYFVILHGARSGIFYTNISFAMALVEGHDAAEFAMFPTGERAVAHYNHLTGRRISWDKMQHAGKPMRGSIHMVGGKGKYIVEDAIQLVDGTVKIDVGVGGESALDVGGDDAT
ncbi:unnamed protein product [Peniophora sp. CBMAI 1063]|nr:unnamed protein product [Peniophora sp. CBMAI 1063]